MLVGSIRIRETAAACVRLPADEKRWRYVGAWTWSMNNVKSVGAIAANELYFGVKSILHNDVL